MFAQRERVTRDVEICRNARDLFRPWILGSFGDGAGAARAAIASFIWALKNQGLMIASY
jgi:hypothetical protein